jgi:hypothetical protein
LIRSRLWGARVPLPRTGYAWLTTDSGQRLLVSPINGLVRCHGDRSATAVAVTVHAPRGVSHCTLKPPGIVRRPRRRNLADPARPVPDPVAVRTYHVHRPGGAGVPRRPSSMTAARPRPDEAAGWAAGHRLPIRRATLSGESAPVERISGSSSRSVSAVDGGGPLHPNPRAGYGQARRRPRTVTCPGTPPSGDANNDAWSGRRWQPQSRVSEAPATKWPCSRALRVLQVAPDRVDDPPQSEQ